LSCDVADELSTNPMGSVIALCSIRPTLASMFGRLWKRLPAIVRGILVAELVESISATDLDRNFIIWVAVMVICFALFVPAVRTLGRRSKAAC
jgi:uncharacterized membrane protein YgaE (UPF0421/DUF939 family)